VSFAMRASRESIRQRLPSPVPAGGGYKRHVAAIVPIGIAIAGNHERWERRRRFAAAEYAEMS